MRSPAEEVPALLNRREVAELLRVIPRDRHPVVAAGTAHHHPDAGRPPPLLRN